MHKIFVASALFTVSVIAPAMAQHHVHAPAHSHATGHHHGGSMHSPYAGMQQREIKALSEQQIDGLRSGKGMAMAMPAELNGYPGPLHVLELTNQLGLSAEQQAKTQKLYAEMKAAAQAQGEQVIATERALDMLFRDKQATPEKVSAAVADAATAQGNLRETHLRYHLSMMEVLTSEQVEAYKKLRGIKLLVF